MSSKVHDAILREFVKDFNAAVFPLFVKYNVDIALGRDYDDAWLEVQVTAKTRPSNKKESTYAYDLYDHVGKTVERLLLGRDDINAVQMQLDGELFEECCIPECMKPPKKEGESDAS